MMDPIRVDWDWFKVAIFTLIALVGGCLGYTARKLDAKEKFSLGVFFFEGISSAFFGFLIGLVSMEHNASLGWGRFYHRCAVMVRCPFHGQYHQTDCDETSRVILRS